MNGLPLPSDLGLTPQGSLTEKCKAWSPEAREAAAAARRGKGGSKQGVIGKLSSSKVKDLLREVGLIPDEVSKTEDGNFIVRKEFFYRSGQSEDQWEAKVSNALQEAGLNFEIVSSGEKYVPFRGGASVKASSHWWTEFKIKES